MHDFHSRETPIDDLLNGIDAGQVALPEFQREFIWTPAQVVDLLRSVARRWPTGSFLLLEAEHSGFASKPVKGAPTLVKRPKILVLDGQQRLTALYHAIRASTDEVYYIDVGALSGSDPDDAFQYSRRKSFEKKYPTLRAAAEQLVLPVGSFYDDDKFYDWLTYVKAPHQTRIRQARDNEMAGLRRHVYRMPCVYLSNNIEVAALAKIFETINRTGERLDVFDLMTAAVYAEGINLREELTKAQDKHPALVAYGIDGIELLKLTCLLAGLDNSSQRLGVRQSDVLNLKPTTVKRYWPRAVALYSSTLDYAKNNLGVISQNLVPSKSMLLSLSVALQAADQGHSNSNFVADWWWKSCFSQTYSQGANTRVVSDSRVLAQGDLPSDLPSKTSDIVTIDSFLDSRRRNEILTRTLGCVLAKNKALLLNTSSRESDEELSMLPIFPVDDPADSARDVVANYGLGVLNAPSRRRSYGAREDLLSTGSTGRSTAKSQSIPWEPLVKGDRLKFYEHRATLLESVVHAMISPVESRRRR